jgi:hypothetical protein
MASSTTVGSSCVLSWEDARAENQRLKRISIGVGWGQPFTGTGTFFGLSARARREDEMGRKSSQFLAVGERARVAPRAGGGASG